jgi:excisionase family DNA binding protein
MDGDTAETVTLQEAADSLGVHYMTAYRYVRLGLLPAAKVGTAWRVGRRDLEAFRERGGLEALGEPRGRRRAPWAERLEARLVAGDGGGAWGIVEAALAAGADVGEVYLDILAPALACIGLRWERGEIDVGTEHRATGIVVRLLGRLGPRFTRRGRTRGAVVLGATAGERHSLPVALLADLVRAGGFEVSDLGADVPAASFLRLAEETPRLVAVGVSVTTRACLASAARTVTVLRRELDGGVALLVGGNAVEGEAHARLLGADAYAADGRLVVERLGELTGRGPDPLPSRTRVR